jgi:hypothetical protein
MIFASHVNEIVINPFWQSKERTDKLMNKFNLQIGLFVVTCLLALSFPLYAIFWIHPHFTGIVAFEKEVNAKQIANHISKMLVFDGANKTLKQESITDSFTETLKEAQVDFDLTKIKIFSSRGEVLYSTDTQDIGALNTEPYFTDIVSKGEIFSKTVHKNEKSMEGEIVKKDVVETYVPLMRDQNFKGAFEIYYDITYSKNRIGQFVMQSHVVILLVSLALLLCILLTSLSAIMYLKKLLKTEKKLQILKDHLPSLYDFSLGEMDE